MKRMQLFLILLTVGIGSAFSDDVIEVKTELVKELGNNVSMSSVYSSGTKILFYKHLPIENSSVTMLDIKIEDIRDLLYTEIAGVYYSCPEYLIVRQVEYLTPRYEGDTYNAIIHASYYYPDEDRFERIKGLEYNRIESDRSYIKVFPGIENNTFYVSYYSGTDHGGYTKTSYFDLNINEEKVITDEESFASISPDRLNALVWDRRQNHNTVKLYNFEINDYIKNDRVIKSYGQPIFLTNDLFLLEKRTNLYIVYNMDFEEKCRFTYARPFDWGDYKEGLFVHATNSSYGLLAKNDSEGYTKDHLVLDLSNEMEILDSLGLLFHPTTAVLNDDRVRMREWPLLDAKHLAFLEEGEEVEVLDRSGIKVKIGDMEDYWYKIKRSGGQTGWSYGHFLDLAEAE